MILIINVQFIRQNVYEISLPMNWMMGNSVEIAKHVHTIDWIYINWNPGLNREYFILFQILLSFQRLRIKCTWFWQMNFFFRLLDVIKRLFNNQIWNDEIIIMIFPFWMSSMSFCLCAVFTFEKNHMIKKKKIILCLTVIWAN